MKSPVNLSVVQQPPVFMNIAESTLLGLSYIKKAATAGSDIIVFPETWLPGYPVWLDHSPKAGVWDYPPAKVLYRILSENSISVDDEYFRELSQAAVDYDILIVMGAHEKVGRTLYNSIIYFKSDGNFELHRKLMPTYTERMIWGMGDGSTLPVVTHKKAVIGGLICWEHWMPLARAAMYEKEEHIHIAQWPMVKELHQLACRNYAFEAQCYVIAAGCALTKEQALTGLSSVITDHGDEPALAMLHDIEAGDKDLLLNGGSCVIGPDTGFLLEPVYGESELLSIEVDLAKIREGNLFIDTNGHYSRPDIFHLSVDTSPKTNVSFEDQ